jgi:hypothetical protein
MHDHFNIYIYIFAVVLMNRNDVFLKHNHGPTVLLSDRKMNHSDMAPPAGWSNAYFIYPQQDHSLS